MNEEKFSGKTLLIRDEKDENGRVEFHYKTALYFGGLE